MKYLILALFAASNAALAAPKIGDFELKRYSDEKSINKLLLESIPELEDEACVSSVLDSPVHQALISSGRYMRAFSLKMEKENDVQYLNIAFEYASNRPKDTSIQKKNLECDLSIEAEEEQNNASGF